MYVQDSVIEELLGGTERYQFSHALIQETLLSELSAARQARLHARIGEALEDIYGADEESHASELAHHFAEAVPVTGSEKLVRYSLLAGEQALAIYAYEEALAHFQRGLVARGIPLNGTEPAPDAQAAELVFGLGRAQAAMAQVHQMQEAIDTLGRALDYYAKMGDVPRVMAVVEHPFTMWPGFTRAHELIARALSLVPPGSPESGRLFSRYGFAVSMEIGDSKMAQEAFSRALAIARQQHDVRLEMRTLASVGHMEFLNLRLLESLEKSLSAIELTDQVDDPYAAFLAHYSAFI
jgi:tetratricopeptide (TPR) repeat protein